jgi:metal-responsive CopG/Arc/MetJ family transcriptional regulator
MATKKPQVLLTIDEVLKKRIDDYWHDNRIISRSGAIRTLIQDALDCYEKKKKSEKRK